jgi:hypothetical protein
MDFVLVRQCLFLEEASGGNSKRQIDDLDELVGVDHAFAPDGIEIGERFFRDGFLSRFSRGLQFLNTIAGGLEHVPEFRQVRFVAERAVPGNNLGVIAGERENFIAGMRAMRWGSTSNFTPADSGAHRRN